MRVTSRRKKQESKVNLRYSFHTKEKRKEETRALVVIEQTKVRKKYIQGCKRTIKDLEKAKQEWEEFQSVDVPSYEQWYNQSFGSDLSQIREAHAKAQDLNSTLQEIRYWMMKRDMSPYEAYKLVMDRKANPEKYRTLDEEAAEREREQKRKWKEKYGKDFFDEEEDFEDEEEDGEFFGDGKEPSEEELRMMFEFFIQANPSIKSKMKDKGFYDFMFERFKEDVLGRKSKNPETDEVDPKTSVEDRIKNIYRILVRKLHPDYQAEITPYMQSLWHEVQEAYKAKDLERLETMLAISNIQTGDFSEEISVSQILNVQSEYKSQLKSLRAQIRKARKRVEWGFSKLTDTKPLSQKIRSDLKMELKSHQFHIQQFEKQLQAWSKPMQRVSKNRYIYV
ncbi:MAG: hypothetical protein KBA66_07305 [Leptospiraceae bacterium]|nr:hypothetical protein [Leptospiraceae bacterium]